MKKVLCTLLSCCMLLGSLSAFAADSADVQMQKALAFAKSKIEVPKELDKFTYQKDDSDTYGGATAWSFRWTNEDRDESISIDCVGDEQIIYYQHSIYDGVDDDASLAKFTMAQGAETANAFLNKIMPASVAPAMSLTDSASSGSDWNYSYVHMVNDIPVKDHAVKINVNKQNGGVSWFSGFYENGSAYPDPKDAVSLADAEKVFSDEIGLELVYRSTYDYRKEALNVFPAYVLSTKGKMVMADGSIKELSDLTPHRPTTENAKDTGAAGSNALSREDAFTPQELDQIQKSAKLISKEQAAAKVTAAFPAAKDAQIKSASLSQDSITKNQYRWNLRLEKDGQYFSASVIAGSGELVSYSTYGDKQEGSLRSEETAKKAVDAFLKSTCGDKLAQCKLLETKKQTVVPITTKQVMENAVSDVAVSNKEDDYYTVQYVRLVNGVPFENNTISATYNRKTGEIEQYNCNWYPDAKFADLSRVKPESEMLESLFKSMNYGLNYRDLDGVKYLCFDFAETSSALFDPVSGGRIGYDGQPYTEKDKPVYTDIADHWCRDMAMSLLENGVYFEGGKLNPETNVTQADFLRLLYQSQQMYADDDNELFYKDVVRRGILTEQEMNANGTVSRADAARYIVRLMGYDKVAKLTGIYQYPFSDAIDPSNIGYVTLCYGFGIVKGDESGHFNPNTAVTRAAAVSMVYYKMTAQ